jgi:glutaminase
LSKSIFISHAVKDKDLVKEMLTCGNYDGSGEFAYRVGLPGKSGVGGGIMAIEPAKASIAVWSPGLDAQGNPVAGQIALEILTKRMGRSIFAA